MDNTTANFWITMSGIISAFLVGCIASVSKCMTKSRCTNIKSPCLTCEREVLSENSEVYKDAENNV